MARQLPKAGRKPRPRRSPRLAATLATLLQTSFAVFSCVCLLSSRLLVSELTASLQPESSPWERRLEKDGEPVNPRYYTSHTTNSTHSAAFPPGSQISSLVQHLVRVTGAKRYSWYVIGTNVGGQHKPHGDGHCSKRAGWVAGAALDRAHAWAGPMHLGQGPCLGGGGNCVAVC